MLRADGDGRRFYDFWLKAARRASILFCTILNDAQLFFIFFLPPRMFIMSEKNGEYFKNSQHHLFFFLFAARCSS
jgi:hypothetical protein